MRILSTVFLGIIAAVAVAAFVIWRSDQPSATERALEDLRESVDRYEAATDALRSLD